ncbi:MAG: xanthan lyase [Paludibacter sp.]|nr:xanthan lyase [Paludibacter sp.]
MRIKLTLYITLLFTCCLSNVIRAQNRSIESVISDSLSNIANKHASIGKVIVTGITVNKSEKKITVAVNEMLSQIPLRLDNVTRIYNAIRNITAEKYLGYSIICTSDSKKIEELIPNFYTPANIDTKKQWRNAGGFIPVVTNLSRPYNVVRGLNNKYLAVWHSHGYYFNQKQNRWEWQRPRLFQTVEDLYTQSYILPFLVPMLENAGANVFVPRERDTRTHEVIVDNDTKNAVSRYREFNDRKSWKSQKEGFGNVHKVWFPDENPFRSGTYRFIPTLTEKDEMSYAEWIPNIPEEGYYAVYVSYKTLEKSTNDARYKVHHQGGITEFSVNQSVHGGTWLYLGHFKFDEGKNYQYKVVLSNYSTEPNRMITADAVKFGGGMGNIARKPSQNNIMVTNKNADSLSVPGNSKITPVIYEAEISGYPRFAEGARYWLQWAGMPDSIYSRSKGENDYTDDVHARGNWVNYLTGSSSVNPNVSGLGIPLDLALAFHTDAGIKTNDSIIGTLGIYTIQNTEGKTEFKNGISRWASRDLTDIVQTQIVNDVRNKYAPEWVRRGMWNKPYSESRTPEVPTMLLELLSHQNFADMRYGLDPRFQFIVSRAIYKGIIKYLSSGSGQDLIVQPLPVEQFSCRFIDKTKLELNWTAVTDSTETTAVAKQFIVYTRINDEGFNNGTLAQNNRIVIDIQPGKIYSFKITAINEGGESFPSEILSAYRSPNEHGEVLIINGFDRISAPASFKKNSTEAGFINDKDAGVPYISDIYFTGKQYDFQRNSKFIDNNSPGFGASYGNYETKVIAGNSFDYPLVHGKAIKSAGFSFVSTSLASVLKGDTDLRNYKYVDLILGKQKKTFVGNAKKTPEFKTFPLALQQKIRTYLQGGGNLMLSGAYIGSDMYENLYIKTEERQFLENVLKIKFVSSKASVNGVVKLITTPLGFSKKSELMFHTRPNQWVYYVEAPDAIEPADQGAYTFCSYDENNLGAGVMYSGKYRTCCMGFPFETIVAEKERNKLMESILSFFSKKMQDQLY